MTASDSDETISIDFNDSQATIPYTDDISYRVEWGPRLSTDSESSESETETSDTPELFSHKYVPDRELAPLSSSFVEDVESENEEQGVEEDAGEIAQGMAVTTVYRQKCKCKKPVSYRLVDSTHATRYSSVSVDL